jgi:hypothetical protein
VLDLDDQLLHFIQENEEKFRDFVQNISVNSGSLCPFASLASLASQGFNILALAFFREKGI